MDAAELLENPAQQQAEADQAYDLETWGNRRLFFERCLKVKTKGGKIIPLKLNRAQLHIDRMLDEQLHHTGKVRALILKGRQQGASTYVAARFYHRTTGVEGTQTFILSHQDLTTQILFNIPLRYWTHTPKRFQVTVGKRNAEELTFPLMDSGYRVATAGSQGVGRGGNVQLFHGSEVAHWPNAHEHATGALQMVGNEDGTEIILESTANGIGDLFYEYWQKAEAGLTEYIAIFVPWFWQEEYQTPPPEDFQMEEEEAEVAELHNLSPAQVFWRRNKIAELGALWRFQQEYPCHANEAFQMQGAETLIKSNVIMRARKAKIDLDLDAALVFGVDCARNITKGDKTSIISRRGRVMGRELFHRMMTDDTMEIAGFLAAKIQSLKPRKVFIDIGGPGSGVYDRLRERGFGNIVVAVNFGSTKVQDPYCKNVRSQIWKNMRDWMEDEGGAQVPDDDTLHRHLASALHKYDSNERLLLVAKELIRKEFGFSPDDGDAAATTFFETVIEPEKHKRMTDIMRKHKIGNTRRRRGRSFLSS